MRFLAFGQNSRLDPGILPSACRDASRWPVLNLMTLVHTVPPFCHSWRKAPRIFAREADSQVMMTALQV
jgi:hypothetical protein